MCRNIRPLFNFEPPATPDEVHAAALQYVRKVAGSPQPSRANEQAYAVAVAAGLSAAVWAWFALDDDDLVDDSVRSASPPHPPRAIHPSLRSGGQTQPPPRRARRCRRPHLR